MDQLWEYVYEISGVVLFCIGLSILFLCNKNLNDLIKTTKVQNRMTNTLYEQKNEEIYEEEDEEKVDEEKVDEIKTICSKSQIIAQLMSNLECDIRIDDIYISGNLHHPMNFDYQLISRDRYRKTCEYGEQGEIVLITYETIVDNN